MSRVATLRRVAAEKEAEIARLRAELAAAESYLDSLEKSIIDIEASAELRQDIADPAVEVRALIHEAGKPLYIDDILRGLGLPLTRATREELRAMLRPWVRRGEVFTRPRPSTYGLVELRRRQSGGPAPATAGPGTS